MSTRTTKASSSRWLREMFQRRCEANPQYTLRKFAIDLGLAPGPLSELMSGKRKLTRRTADQIGRRLGLGVRELRQLHTLVGSQPRKSTTLPGVMLRGRGASELRTVDQDTFAAVADPCHYYILSLLETDDFRSDEQWIAERLGIERERADEAVARMLRLGILERDKAGDLVAAHKRTSTGSDIPSVALRNAHRLVLEDAVAALESVPMVLRDVTSSTVALAIDKLPKAKALIAEFRRGLCEFLEDGSRDEVYNLNIQLVPVSRIREREQESGT